MFHSSTPVRGRMGGRMRERGKKKHGARKRINKFEEIDIKIEIRDTWSSPRVGTVITDT